MFFSESGEYGKSLLANLHMRLNTAGVFSEYVQILPAYIDMLWSEASPKFIVFSMYDLKVGTNENGSACGRWQSIGI